MNRGSSRIDSKAEPNLTPLLDVVLQLLMFFMMCVNFVTEQVNSDIALPDAQSARPGQDRSRCFVPEFESGRQSSRYGPAGAT
jgi:biopolymer transport protein ExbD